MVGLKRLSWKIPQTLAYVFVAASVVYTTDYLFVSPLSSFISTVAVSLVEKQRSSTVRSLETSSYLASTHFSDIKRKDGISSDFAWFSTPFTLQNGLGHRLPLAADEKLVLSKAFANSMHPPNIKPYFYRAQGSFDPDDITITTLITSNRFSVFARLVEKYQGPISVTVHVKDVSEHVQQVLQSLHDVYTSSESMVKYVDVHLVVDAFDRQFNTWRNIARLFARTNFVMMLDIDFYPCTDFRSVIKRSSTILDKLHAGRAALVIPAFEYVDFQEGINYASFPTKKSELLALVKERRIDMFHAFWGPGHNSSDYKHFYNAPSGEVYKVTKYQAAYEPYVIFKKDGPPWCDERFVGYGGNKAACLFEMYLAGISYYVLADHFIIHQNHLYEESARKNERRVNRKVYADFKEESCLRASYLKKYHDHGVLASELAENALTECRKIKSVVRAVPKYFRK